MEKISAILIDDEAPVRNLLKNLIQENFSELKVIGEGGSISEAVKLINKLKPDIVFLDIEMPGYSGLQIMDFFEPEEVDFDIIFITAYSEYAITAFKISAFDYLLKPINQEDLKNSLERYSRRKNKLKTEERMSLLSKQLDSGKMEKIGVSSLDGINFINVGDIIYLEASGMYTVIVLESEKELTVSKPLKEFEDLLEKDKRFFRPHRSFLVNLEKITKYSRKEGTVIYLSNNKEIPLSRYRKSEFDVLMSSIKL